MSTLLNVVGLDHCSGPALFAAVRNHKYTIQTKGICKIFFSAITVKGQAILFIVNYALKCVFKMTVKLRDKKKPKQENNKNRNRILVIHFERYRFCCPSKCTLLLDGVYTLVKTGIWPVILAEMWCDMVSGCIYFSRFIYKQSKKNKKQRKEKSPGSATITSRSASQTPRGRGNRQNQTSANRTNVRKALRLALSSPSDVIAMLRGLKNTRTK